MNYCIYWYFVTSMDACGYRYDPLMRDFPAKELAKHDLVRWTPDELLVDLYDAGPELLIDATARARVNLTKSAISPTDFLGALNRQNLRRFAKTMAAHLNQFKGDEALI